MRLWNIEAGAQIRRLDGHTIAPRGVLFTPDGKQAVSTGADRTIRICDIASGNEISRIEEGVNAVGLALSPDGTHAIAAGFQSRGESRSGLVLWNLKTGEPTHELHGHTKLVCGAAISHDGRTALSVAFDGTARLWSLPESVWPKANAADDDQPAIAPKPIEQ